MSTIVVLVKHVPDTWSTKQLESDYTLDRVHVDSVIDEVNEYAVEQALQLKEADDSYSVVAVTMGPEAADEALRKALAMGADDAIRLTDDGLAGSDSIGTAWALNAVLATLDDVAVVMTGSQSSDGETGLLPGLLAEYRQLPALTDVSALELDGAELRAIRVDERGTWSLSAPLPTVVSVTDKGPRPRYPNFKRMKAAKAHEITIHSLSSLGIDPAVVGLDHAATRVQAAEAQPGRVAGQTISGRSPEEAAAAIADFLAERGLI